MSMVQAQKETNDNKLPVSGKALIKSRFGEIEVDYSKAVYFPKGLYGFPPELHFSIVQFPNPNLQAFSLLQCLNDHSISFPVFPVGYNNEFIHEKDMNECIKAVDVDPKNFAMLFISSSEKNDDGTFKVSVNTKAPIIVDVNLQMAVQYIFTNNKYSTKHYIV